MKFARSLFVAGLAAAGFATQAHALAVYGVTTTNSLVRFDSATPGVINGTVALSGLTGTLLGIDFRPTTGELFGLTSDSRLYTINVLTGAATAVGAAGQFVLTGSSFGFDFNPTVDRIRVTSNTGQDLRLNPLNGAIAATDPNLTYAPGDPNAAAVPSVVASAYTNSFAGSATTTLYDIDSSLDILAIQNPPNNGVLNTVGSLGLNASNNVGFDIFYFGNQGFASIQFAGAAATGFYGINLGTGAASLIGNIGNNLVVTDIAIAAVPEPTTAALLGIGVFGLALRARRRRQ